MTEDFWFQAAILFYLSYCFFHFGGITNGIPMNWRARWEIVQAAVIVVALFAIVSEGRGCTTARTTEFECASAAESEC